MQTIATEVEKNTYIDTENLLQMELVTVIEKDEIEDEIEGKKISLREEEIVAAEDMFSRGYPLEKVSYVLGIPVEELFYL